MSHLQKLVELGSGSFGVVYLAYNQVNQEFSAVKAYKKSFDSVHEARQDPELNFLSKAQHPNIVNLKDLVFKGGKLQLELELMDADLGELIKEKLTQKAQFTEDQIRSIMFQLISGVVYIHSQGYFHRDLKPENVMVDHTKIKLADFGTVKTLEKQFPYTSYISTRWYRAPECCFRARQYDTSVDVFAIGCIMAELYLQQPIFMGHSELDQIHKICSVLGSPSKSEWPEGYKSASKIGYSFPENKRSKLGSVLCNASSDAKDLIKAILQFNPKNRPSAAQLLKSPFFVKHQRDLKGQIVIKETKTNDPQKLLKRLQSHGFDPTPMFQGNSPEKAYNQHRKFGFEQPPKIQISKIEEFKEENENHIRGNMTNRTFHSNSPSKQQYMIRQKSHPDQGFGHLSQVRLQENGWKDNQTINLPTIPLHQIRNEYHPQQSAFDQIQEEQIYHNRLQIPSKQGAQTHRSSMPILNTGSSTNRSQMRISHDMSPQNQRMVYVPDSGMMRHASIKGSPSSFINAGFSVLGPKDKTDFTSFGY